MRGPILSVLIAATGCADEPVMRSTPPPAVEEVHPGLSLEPDLTLAGRVTTCILRKGAIPDGHDLVAELKMVEGGTCVEAGVVVPGSSSAEGVNLHDATLQVAESVNVDCTGPQINFQDGDPTTGPDAMYDAHGSNSGKLLTPMDARVRYRELLEAIDAECDLR